MDYKKRFEALMNKYESESKDRKFSEEEILFMGDFDFTELLNKFPQAAGYYCFLRDDFDEMVEAQRKYMNYR